MKKSKKIDVIILSSLSRDSGCFLRATYLGKSLADNGLEVKVITPPKSMKLMLEFPVSFFIYLFYILKYRFKIGIAIKPYPNSLIPLLIKKFISGIKVVVDIDDIDFGYRKGIFTTLLRYLQKPLPGLCDYVTYHNKRLKNFIIEEYKVEEKKLVILSQGVDFNIYDYKKDVKNFKERLRERLSLKERTKIIIYTAHLNIASDLDVILDNINDLLNRRDHFFIIAGGGPMFNYFKNYAKNKGITKIYFTGYLKPNDIVKYILSSDVALVYYKDKPVNYYRSSMKLREYLALKRKVVSNDVGELKDFKHYVYQSKKDIKSFIKMIDDVLQKKRDDRRERKGYKFVKENYNWDKIGKDFLKAIDE